MTTVHTGELTAVQWLAAWDANDIVPTIEMGGLGPGYEQCIQILVAELLRALITRKIDASKWGDTPEGRQQWKEDRAVIESVAHETIDRLGPSGAQMGAALNLATAFYKRGPSACLAEVGVARRLQVQRDFPR